MRKLFTISPWEASYSAFKSVRKNKKAVRKKLTFEDARRIVCIASKAWKHNHPSVGQDEFSQAMEDIAYAVGVFIADEYEGEGEQDE